jgi:hypothetical protein
MKEFFLLIRNQGEGKAALSARQQQDFLQACEVYIKELRENGNLLAAQPLEKEGRIISGNPGAFQEGPYQETSETMVGYYHILAPGLDAAVAIAKRNPEFAFVQGARIEVRPVKMIEESTRFVYPKGS